MGPGIDIPGKDIKVSPGTPILSPGFNGARD